MDDFISNISAYSLPLMGGLGGFGSGGLYLNLKLTLLSVPLCIVIGCIVSIVRIQKVPLVGKILDAYVEVSKSVPIILGIFWFYNIVPLLTGYEISVFEGGLIALVFFGAGYVAEVVKSGWNTIDKQEIELAEISGVSRYDIICYIVLPQIVYTMLPALISVSISLFKDTSTIYIIGLVELTQSGMNIANRNPDLLPTIYLIIGVAYLVVCSTLSLIGSIVEKRWAGYSPSH